MSLKIFLEYWNTASKDLNLVVREPFTITLDNNIKLEAILLLENFGAKNGMLIFNNYDEIEKYASELINKGFGYSVLSLPRNDEEYNKQMYIEMLSDWGWSRDQNCKPKWIKKNLDEF